MALGALANPIKAPTPPPLGNDQCTTTLTHTINGFRGHWTPFIERTIYTSTRTVFSRVPCGGCHLSITTKPAPFWGGVGPAEIVTGTVTAKEPTNVTSTICATETTPHHGAIPHAHARRNTDELASSAVSAEGCTITQPVPLHLTFGPVETIWTETETATVFVDCGTCENLQTSTVHFIGKGPAVVFTTTETATEPTVSTTYLCLATPTDVLPTETPGDESWDFDLSSVSLGNKRHARAPSTTTVAPTAYPTFPGHREKSCTTTKTVRGQVEGGTWTAWPFTITDTRTVNCHGCRLEVTTKPIEYIAAPRYTTTVISKEPSTAFNYVCAQRTASPDGSE